MAANRIYIQVDFQSQSANQAITTLNKNIASIGTTAQKSTQQATAGIGRMNIGIEQSIGWAKKFWAALIAIQGFKFFQSIDQIELVRLQLERTVGSGERARDIFAQIQQIGSRQLIDAERLGKAAVALNRAKVEAQQLPRWLQAISDAAATQPEQFEAIIERLKDLQAEIGAIPAGKLEKFQELGIDAAGAIRRALEQQLGTQITDAMFQRILAGEDQLQIGGKAAAQIIIEAMEKEFAGQGIKVLQRLNVEQLTQMAKGLTGSAAAALGDLLRKVKGVQQGISLGVTPRAETLTAIGPIGEANLKFIEQWTKATDEMTESTKQFWAEAINESKIRELERATTVLESFPRIGIEQIQSISEQRLQIETDSANKIYEHRKGLAEDAKAAAEKEMTDANLRGELRVKQQAASDQRYNAQVQKAAFERDDAIARNRLEAEIQANQLILEDFQRQTDRLNEYAERQAQRRIARLEVLPAQTPAEEMERARQRAGIFTELSETTLRNNIDLLDQQRRQYEQLLRTVYAKPEQADQLTEALRQSAEYYAREETDLRNKAADDQALHRLEAERRVNEIILHEWRAVYDEIRGIGSQLFDALFQKSTSVWKALADTFKNIMTNALREIWTSRFAQLLGPLFGTGQVTFQGGWLERVLGRRPVFDQGTAIEEPVQKLDISTRFLTQATQNLTFATENLASVTANLSLVVATSGAGDAVVSRFGVASRAAQGRVSQAEWDAFRREFSLESGQAAYRQLPTGGVPTIPGIESMPATRFSTTVWGTAPAPTAAGPSMEQLWNLPQRRWRLPSAMPSLPLRGSNLSEWVRKQKANFNIGKPIRTATGIIPWAQATPRQKLGSVVNSEGFAALASMVGLPTAMAGLQRGGVMGDIMATGGGALAGVGIASMIGLSAAGGAVLGAGAGLFAAGVRRGGAAGVAMTTVGGIMAGAMIGAAIGGPVGLVAGAAIGGAVGLGTGIARLFYRTADEKVRQKIKEIYGVDLADRNIRQQIVEIAKQRYGGNVDLAVRSAEVQELVRLYAVATGANARLPRPMYSATFAQSGAGGLQLQPVYENGKMIASPYSGVTTQQWASAGLYVQLDPKQANDLFEGRVVNVIQGNPASVGAASARAARSSESRQDLRSSLMEPLTVMR